MPAPHCAAMTAIFFAAPHQRGAAAIEFAVAGAMVLLLGLLGVEAARWQAVRQMTHVALMEAARAGATAHGDPIPMRDAFLHGLLPLYASAHGETGARLELTRVQAELGKSVGLTPWRIEVLGPNARAFREHGGSGMNVPAAPARRTIDNSYQDLQHARRPPRPGGPSIFQANTLTLRLTYLHKPWLAPVRAVLAASGRNNASYAGVARQHGLLPIQIELEIEMHSDPVDWTDSGRYPAEIVAGACRQARCN